MTTASASVPPGFATRQLPFTASRRSTSSAPSPSKSPAPSRRNAKSAVNPDSWRNSGATGTPWYAARRGSSLRPVAVEIAAARHRQAGRIESGTCAYLASAGHSGRAYNARTAAVADCHMLVLVNGRRGCRGAGIAQLRAGIRSFRRSSRGLQVPHDRALAQCGVRHGRGSARVATPGRSLSRTRCVNSKGYEPGTTAGRWCHA